MKWATKKSAMPHCSLPMTRVFPVSWFFKCKQNGGNSDKHFEFTNQKSYSCKEGRFYSMDEDDCFWRLSFGDERIQGRKSLGGIKPLSCDRNHEFFELKDTESRRDEECRDFDEMVSDIKKMRVNRGKQRIETGEIKTGDSTRKRGDLSHQTSRKFMGFDVEDESLQERFSNSFEMASDVKKMGENRGKQRIVAVKRGELTRKRGDSNNQNSRKLMGFDGENEKSSNLNKSFLNSVEKVSDMKKMRENRGKQRIVAGKTGDSFRKRGDSNDQTPRKLMGFDGEEEKYSNLNERFSNSVSKGLDIEGRMLKSESKKKLNQGISPRTECKISALEEKKKTRTKTKKKEKVLEQNTVFDSFAVVKSSYNPEEDFKESMMEMIIERGIESGEDLEELLACYLTLNSDKNHDLIIKVFRQVCFELIGAFIDHRI